ncbi:MAG: hypothetical protein IJ192_08395 [Clostridia bacterium]|nr:hypothetical protein [Clostridia bacterium]
MKGKFVFDAAENDIVNVNEETVIRDTGVKAEDVKETVMMKVRNEKKPVRKIRRKNIISLVAAAAAVAVLGTVTVGAAGGFNSTFGEYFAGEPADGVYSGKDVTIISDKVDIDFAGIAGDDDQVIAMMTIKNKDGSPFVKTTENTYIDQYDSGDIDSVGINNAVRVETDQTLWDTITGTSNFNFGDISYSFKDDSTISAMITCTNNNNGTLKGRRLHASDEKIYAYTNIKTLYTAEDGDGYSRYETADDGSRHMVTYGPILEELTEEYKNQLEKNQVIIFNNHSSVPSVIIAEKTEINLDFEVGVTLNYKSTTHNIESAAGKTYKINNSDWTIDYITAKSFTITLSSHSYELPENKDIDKLNSGDKEETEKYFAYQNAFIPHDLTITLKNGSVYHTTERLLGSNGGYTIGNNYGEVELIYGYEDENGNDAALDPSQIVSITLDGQELI